jgi:hypothetical protein
VTEDSITLGYFTDLSGPASASGEILYHGTQLYINQASGVDYAATVSPA